MRLTVCLLAAVAVLPVAAAAQPHPDISGVWTRGGAGQTLFQAPPSGPGPVLQQPGREGEFPTHRLGDYNAPILQPWAAAIVRQHTELDQTGKSNYSAQETCWPMGVPYILQLNFHTMIVDDGKQVVFMYERHMQPRIARLNATHPAAVKPSWFGDSVAHWDGDTLVVDTVGLDKRSWVDVFGTPHTDKLHVVERYRRTAPDGLNVTINVDDPGAFTTPWSAVITYRKDRDPYLEVICQENNIDAATGKTYPMPVAARADF